MAQPPGFAGKGPLRLSGQSTGTTPIQEHQRFDVGALESYLRNHGFSGPLTVRQFKGGQSNPTYLISGGGGRHVLRAQPGPAAELLPSPPAVGREEIGRAHRWTPVTVKTRIPSSS